MKHLIYLAAVVSVSVGACAQGTVNFNNSKAALGGPGAPVTCAETGARLGSNYLAQLWAGPDANSLAPIGATLAFRDGVGAGFLNTTGQDTVRVIPTVTPGGVATVQIWVWDGSKGATYLDSMHNGGATGKSHIFTVTTGGNGEPVALPANLIMLTPFSVSGCVSEPTTLALGALGLGALLWCRRA